MVTLIISDTHNRIDVVDKIIKAHPDVDKIISLGDWWDSFGDTVEDAEKTARYLLNLSQDKRFIWIAGNHDLPYLFPDNLYIRCSGGTKDKANAIQKVFKGKTPEFCLHHFDEYFLYSHAGLHPSFLPYDGFSPEWLELRCRAALALCSENKPDDLVLAGRSRGGFLPYGGITWLDHYEFTPIENLNQIYGHTRAYEPRQTLSKSSVNWCLDTNNNHYALVTNGKIEIKEYGTI